MKVFLSQPFRQHSHQLLKAIIKAGYDAEVFTLVNASSASVKKLFSLSLLSKFAPALQKRSFQQEGVIIHSTGITSEIKRNLERRFSSHTDEEADLKAEIRHDRKVAAKINAPVVLIGYEKSCLESFKKNKSLGGINVLDLAGVYYTKLVSLRNEFEIYRNTLPPQQLFDKICKRKQQEIDLADHVIVLSAMVKTELIKGGVEAGKISVVQLGYDPSVFSAKENYNNNEMLKVIFVGAISYRKGVALIVEAAKQLIGKPVQFTLVGPASDAAELLQHLPANISHISYLSHQELAKEYRKADVFLFPSYLDSYGMVVAEAMASGLPVIVSENTGAKDIIGDAGMVIPVNDVNALRKGVELFLDKKEETARMGKMAAATVKQYNWDHYYKQIDSILSKLNAA